MSYAAENSPRCALKVVVVAERFVTGARDYKQPVP